MPYRRASGREWVWPSSVARLQMQAAEAGRGQASVVFWNQEVTLGHMKTLGCA